MRTLGGLLESIARRGERAALVAFRRGTAVDRWTCDRLADRASRLAVGLRATGLVRGHAVVLLAPNSPEWIVACLGILQAGGVAAPVDAQTDDDALAAVIATSRAALAFTTARGAERLAQVAPALRCLLLDAPDDDRSWTTLPVSTQSVAASDAKPGDLAVLFFTSGTTGPSKCVPLTHANLAYQVDALLAQSLVAEDDRLLVPLPLHHVYPFVVGMLVPLAAGVPIVLPRSITGPQLARALREGEATALLGVPRLHEELVTAIESRVVARGRLAAAAYRSALATSVFLRRRLRVSAGRIIFAGVRRGVGPRLRLLASGGAALDPDVAWKLAGLGWQVASGYGLTETSPLLTLSRPGEDRFEGAGRPIPGVELRIDASATPLADAAWPPGAGEVLARGPGVFAGYRDLPENTVAAFSADGWFRTGDLGVIEADGSLRLLGRASSWVKTAAGKLVQVEELEEAYGESPGLSEVAVLEREKGLVALIVTARRTTPWTPDEERAAVQAAIDARSRSLPTWKRLCGFAVTHEALPRTRLGKLKRHLLDERYDAAAGGREARARRGPMPVEAMSGEDRALLEDPAAFAAWDVLCERFADRRLGPDSSVRLDLGVDSLGWLDLAIALHERTGTELGDDAVGRIETVRDLLREIAGDADETDRGAARAALALSRPEDALDPSERLQLAVPGAAAWVAARALHAVLRCAFRRIFRCRVEGLDRVPREGALLLAPNHASYLDPFLLAAALPPSILRRTHWAGWTPIVHRNRLVAALSRFARVIPVEPHGQSATTLAFGAAVLRRGDVLVWFPEGRRTENGRLGPFLPGVGALLDAVPDAAVVPVFLRGTFDACPKGRVVPRLRRLGVVFGERMTKETLAARSQRQSRRDAIAAALHDAVAALDGGPVLQAPHALVAR